MVRRITFYDTETTGVDPQKDVVIEVGLLLWSAEHRTTLAQASYLVRNEAGNAAEQANHIPAAALVDDAAISSVDAWHRVQSFFRRADLVVAHKASFDKAFTPPSVRDLKPWLCTIEDVEWPIATRSKNLRDIAIEHGVAVTEAHRALTDCILGRRLFEAVAKMVPDFQAWLAEQLEPKPTYRVAQGGFSRERNELAKEHGFVFHDADKSWRRKMRAEKVALLPFDVVEVQP
jgi:DNA polymerase-3 subunit epsilon